jgi:hypothetical protein
MTKRRVPAALATAGVLLALTACGGDDDDNATATTTTAPTASDAAPTASDEAATADAEFAEYCALALEIDQLPSMPTADQMETILAAAPEEIAAEAKTFVDAFVAAGDDVSPGIFADYGDEMAVIDAFEAEHCGMTSEQEEPPDPAVVSIDPAATRVDVDATDFHFEFEPPTATGRYSFVMTNDGEELHMLILAQMEPGATFDEVMASEGEEGLIQSFESIPSEPGGESVVTADLTTGHWLLVCPIPSEANGMAPHTALGMVHEWDVS